MWRNRCWRNDLGSALCTAPWRATVSLDPVNSHADQLIDSQVLDATRSDIADVFRGDIVNAHSDQLIGIRMLVSQRLQFVDKLGRDAMNAEGNELFQINV